MRLGVVLAPVADPRAVVDAARAADELKLHAVGLWDHYHSALPEWGYAAGWSMFGAIAEATDAIRIVPMVLNGLQHDVGRLSKEVAMLDLLSAGRFELAIGLGDWPEAFAAWGQPFPPRAKRTARLVETLQALEALWRGGPVTTKGENVRLEGAISAPAPASSIRIVGGAGGANAVIADLAPYVDELNVYAEPHLIDAARAVIAAHGRCRAVSTYLDWSWDRWPSDVPGALAKVEDLDVDRVFIAVGSADMHARIAELAAART